MAASPFTENAFQPQSKRRESKLTDMSPEARRAMYLAREDTKENFLTISSRPLQPPSKPFVGLQQRQNVDMANARKDSPLKADRRRDLSRGNKSDTGTKEELRPSRAAHPQPTARSRSTLSHTDRTSDRVERNRRARAANTNQLKDNGSVKNVPTNGKGDENNASSNNVESVGDEAEYKSSFATEGGEEWGADECLSLVAGEDSQNVLSDPSSASFAVALHNALSHNGTERLRGDITDHAKISEPGTVRALNGGRLTNAQEVVVNVCHDDEKELVFHDDDDESLETAKTISQIRINVWLEYNEKFTTECVYEDQEDDTLSEVDSVPEFKRSQTSISPRVNQASSNPRNAHARDTVKAKPPVSKPGINKARPVPARTRSAMPTGKQKLKS